MLKTLASATLFASAFGLTDYVKQNVRQNFGNHRLIALENSEINSKIATLLNSHGADDVGHHNNAVHLRLTPEAIEALNAEGVKFEDHTERFLSEMEYNLNQPGFFCTEGTKECARRTQDEFYASYHDMDTYYQRLEDLSELRDDVYFETIGYSWEGRAMKTIFIGDQTKPLVFYFCNIHAREWITPPFCVYMAEQIIGANGAGHDLLEKFSFAILPSANPDGYEYSRTVDNAWRKTRKPNPGQSCIGTDGNRNYPINFAGEGASTDACTETYAGHSPLDQNETRAIADFGLRMKGRLYAYNDAHSYGEYWMSPWAGTYALPPEADFDKMKTCFEAAGEAIEAVHGVPFKIGSVANTIYIAAGGSVDWFYQNIGVIYAYTLEARGAGLSGIAGFQPPPSNILPSNEELFAGMEASLNCGFQLDFAAPTDFPTPAPTVCEDRVPNGITYVDGTPAPCSELGNYCSLYSFVPERCPATCGSCDDVKNKVVDVSEVMVVEKKSAGNFLSVTSVALIAVGAACLGAAAALAAVIVTKKNKKTEEKAIITEAEI